MELTIDQVIHQGDAAHRKGNLQEAERLYRAILKTEPKHPLANHNLGLIAIAMNKLELALPFFKAALVGNPNFQPFWVSYESAVIQDYENGYARKVIHESNIDFSTGEIKNSLDIGLNMTSSNSLFINPSPIEYESLYRPGMGTENIGGFLRAMAMIRRPSRILEIGAGYTTPFLLEALVNNERVYDDGNLNNLYLDKVILEPKLVVIDNMSLGELASKPGMKDIISSKYTDFVEGNFEDKSNMLFKKYGNFDFVWFDCGGAIEYQIFMEKYWDICSGYIFFHNTYSSENPNDLHKIIHDNATGNPFIFDIIEPHKKRQGSITMVKKRDCI